MVVGTKKQAARQAFESTTKDPKTLTTESGESGSKSPKKARRSARYARADAEQAEGPGDTAKGWPRTFKEEVQQKEGEVLTRLEGIKSKLYDGQRDFRDSVLPILRLALLPLEAAEADTPDANQQDRLIVQTTAIGQQQIGDRIADIIEDSYHMLEQYKDLCKPILYESRLDEISTICKKDTQAALALLAAGRRVAMSDIQDMLADRFHEVRDRSVVTPEEDAKGRLLLSKGHREEDDGAAGGGVGWGTIALEARKAVDKLGQVAVKR